MQNDTPRQTAPSVIAPAAPATAPQSIWKHGVIAAVVAAIVTSVLAAIASAAGVSFANKPGGEGIPVPMFTVLTLVFSLIGVGIAVLLSRKARKPRSTFVRTAVGLALLSVVPDLTFGFDGGSAATLIGLHTIAAAIVIPTLAKRLAPTR